MTQDFYEAVVSFLYEVDPLQSHSGVRLMVDQYQAKDSSLTVYLNGLAHVVATTNTPVASQAEISNVSPQLVLESLHPVLASHDTKILEARLLEPTRLSEIARNLAGQDVRVVGTSEVYDGVGGASLRVLAGEGDRVVGYSHGKAAVIPLRNVWFDAEAVPTHNQTALALRLEDAKEDKPLVFSYLTEGIALTPHYTIQLRGKRLVLTADVEMENRTGKTFTDVALEVVPGEVGRPYLTRNAQFADISRRVMSESTDLFMMDEVALEEGVSATEREGQISYGFGKQTIPQGRSKFGVFATKPLAYDIAYTASLNEGRSGINAMLRFTAPTTLPAGSVAVYSERNQGGRKNEHYEGGSTISNPVLRKRKVNITLRQPDTLDMKVLQKGESRVVQTTLEGKDRVPVYALIRTYEATVRNAGQHAAMIEASLYLSPASKVLDSSLKEHSKSTGQQKRWDVKVPAGEKVILTYTVQEPIQFRQVAQHEVEALLKKGRRVGRK